MPTSVPTARAGYIGFIRSGRRRRWATQNGINLVRLHAPLLSRSYVMSGEQCFTHHVLRNDIFAIGGSRH